jgi:hypothetical protein
MNARIFVPLLCGAGLIALTLIAPAQQKRDPIGYDDTPVLPNQPWRVHDIKRPHPKQVTPGRNPGDAPSDAIVLFDGKDLSAWEQRGRGEDRGKMLAPKWKVENGYFEVVGGTGDLLSKEKFGDAQYHVEWSSPAAVKGDSQNRGNSGFLMMSRYEIQVLDAWNNVTYADGQAGSIYGQWPPLVNPARKPGEWNVYDIAFEAPVFEDGQLKRPAYVTVFYNGVLVHHRKEFIGRMAHRVVGTYAPHGPEEALMLQDHGEPVRYRNIWVRRLSGYDGTPRLTP